MARINHVAAYVKDLEKAKDFFVKYFNATPNKMYHNPHTGLKTYFLAFDYGARLEIMIRPGLSYSSDSGTRVGYVHVAFSLGSREEVDKLTSRLANDGYKVMSGARITGDGYYESCVEGIDNLILELTE